MMNRPRLLDSDGIEKWRAAVAKLFKKITAEDLLVQFEQDPSKFDLIVKNLAVQKRQDREVQVNRPQSTPPAPTERTETQITGKRKTIYDIYDLTGDDDDDEPLRKRIATEQVSSVTEEQVATVNEKIQEHIRNQRDDETEVREVLDKLTVTPRGYGKNPINSKKWLEDLKDPDPVSFNEKLRENIKEMDETKLLPFRCVLARGMALVIQSARLANVEGGLNKWFVSMMKSCRHCGGANCNLGKRKCPCRPKREKCFCKIWPTKSEAKEYVHIFSSFRLNCFLDI